MHVLHRSSLIYLWWNNYVIIRPFCHIIVVCFLWTWHSGSKLGWYRPDAGSHRADASVFLTHNANHIQSGEGAYRRGNSLDDSRLWSAAVEPDGRACAEWTINPTVPVCIVDQTGVHVSSDEGMAAGSGTSLGILHSPHRCLLISSQRAHDAIITSFRRQSDVSASFWRHDNVILVSCVRWEADYHYVCPSSVPDCF